MKKLLNLLIILSTLSSQIIIGASAPEKKIEDEARNIPGRIPSFKKFKKYIATTYLNLDLKATHTPTKKRDATNCFNSAFNVIRIYTKIDFAYEYMACLENNFAKLSAYEYAQPASVFFSHLENPEAHPIMQYLCSESRKPEHLQFMMSIDKDLHTLVIEKETVKSITGSRWRIYQSFIYRYTLIQWLDENWRPTNKIDLEHYELAGGGNVIGFPYLRIFLIRLKQLFSDLKHDPIIYIRMFDLNNPTTPLAAAPAKAEGKASATPAAAAEAV